MRKRRNLHKQQVLKRKNFFPTLILTLFLWLTIAGLVYFVDPASFGAVPAFFALVFTGILFTSSLIFANSRRGLITAIAFILFLFLAYLGIGNILNLILIVAIAVTIELYFTLK